MISKAIAGAWEPAALPNGDYVAPMKVGGVLKTHLGDLALPGGQPTLRYPVLAPGRRIAGTGQTDNLAWLYDGAGWASRPCYACPRACIFLADGTLQVALTPADTGSQGYIQLDAAGRPVQTQFQNADLTRRLWEYTTYGGITVGQGGDGPDGQDPVVAQVRDGTYRLVRGRESPGDLARCHRVVFNRDGDRLALAWYEPTEARMLWLTVAELEALPVYVRPPLAQPVTIAPFAFETAVAWFDEASSRPSVTPSPAPGQWSIVGQAGLRPPKPVILGLPGDDDVDLIAEWAGRWAQVRGVYVFDEASRAGLQAQARLARSRMDARGLARRSVYSYSAENVWPDIQEVDVIGIQCYPKAGEPLAVSVAKWRAAVAKAAGRPVALVCGLYDRRPTLVSEDALRAALPAYAALGREVKARAFLCFAWGRLGGASAYPSLRPGLEALAAAVVRTPPVIVTPPTTPPVPPKPPSPPPTEPPMPTPCPTMSFDASLALVNEIAALWQQWHPAHPGCAQAHLQCDWGQLHLWFWRSVTEGWSREKCLRAFYAQEGKPYPENP